MTTEANNDNTKSSEREGSEETGNFTGCEPGCGCGGGAGKVNQKLKIIIPLVLVVAACGIFLFKTNSSDSAKNGFSISGSVPGAGGVLNSAAQQGRTSLSKIAELNTMAAKMDTVFVFIPGKDNAPITKETGAVLASVERSLNAKGLSTGIFTLQTNSTDYPNLAAKVAAPGIAVLTKGSGIGFVQGGITESSLMQAYVASAGSSGATTCSSCDCGASEDSK
ncbi:MAG: hypothetical protein HGA78_06505 [Nitrospirales bacterium]|nr:hypothetical protein [Nitrospirales bacterium]